MICQVLINGVPYILIASSSLLLVSLLAWPPSSTHSSVRSAGRNLQTQSALRDASRRLSQDKTPGLQCTGVQEDLRPCHLQQTCGVSGKPVDCLWGAWADWGACSCVGSQSRQRSIVQQSVFGGKPCQGPGAQSQPCNSTCPEMQVVDCQLAQWSSWSACTRSCEGGQKHRTREIAKNSLNGGALCSSRLHEISVCNLQDCPGHQTVNCQWSDWTSWSACTVTCGSGQKRRFRSVKTMPKNGGKLCVPGNTIEIAQCGKPGSDCDGRVDCWWGSWGKWSTCSKTCGSGQKFRVREVLVQAARGGAGCEGTFQSYAECSNGPCPIESQDCRFGDWSSWSLCTSECNGHRSRSRAVVSIAKKGGKPCDGSTTAVFPCNVDSASCARNNKDCAFSPWTAWSPCSVTCAGGTATRTRGVQVHALGYGKSCSGDMEQVRECHLEPCLGNEPRDCRWGTWSSWDSCSEPCGGGQQRRHRIIIKEPKNGGKPCEPGRSLEVFPCNIQPCAHEELVCDWSGWGDWSPCMRDSQAVDCGTSQKSRTRVTKFFKNVIAGRRLDELMVDAFVPSFTQSRSNHERHNGNGTSSRRLSTNNCKSSQQEVQPCSLEACAKAAPIDCVWNAWSDWAVCSCNGDVGVTERHRDIAHILQSGGKPCEGPKAQVRQCDVDCKSDGVVDCAFSAWTEWSGCSVTCSTPSGGELVLRARTIIRYPRGSGRQCMGPLQQTKPCDIDLCPKPIDCKWGQWTGYSACSQPCGGGQQSRSRNVVQTAQAGGKPCSSTDSMQVSPCNLDPCPVAYVDCQFDPWGPWDVCSATCGGGKQRRVRSISVQASDGGKACSGTFQEFRRCGAIACTSHPTIGCAWGQWSYWGACSAKCNGYQERTRAITQFASNGGTPCKGSEREITPCNLHAQDCLQESPADCVLSAWDPWSSCSMQCDGGQKYRSRIIRIPARNSGKPCAGPLRQAQPCNLRLCAGGLPVDCKWSLWDEWSACSKSCEGGQKTRRRQIQVEPVNGGQVCEARDSMIVASCRTQPCQKVSNKCMWSVWSEWSDCTSTCGGGQQQRTRQLSLLPISIVRQRRLVAASLNGDCAGTQKAIQPCSTMPCADELQPVACSWAQWGNWGACSCAGLQERERSIARAALNGGPVCEAAARETRRCIPHCEPAGIDCIFGPWSDWNECSASCGGGQRLHTRVIKVHASAYGRGCEGGMEETEACMTLPCSAPTDCTYSTWSAWGPCSATCGGGQQTRSRKVKSSAKNGGKTCAASDLMSVGACNTQQCTAKASVDCKWTVWGTWSSCSATCGSARQVRKRRVARKALYNGKPCTGLYQEYRDCVWRNCEEVGVDCSFTAWSNWGACTDPCLGHQERARSIARYSTMGGKLCEGGTRQVRACASDPRLCDSSAADVDCVFTSWGSWSDCSRSCNGGQMFASRTIAQQARGKGRPCAAALKRTRSCKAKPCPGDAPVNCKWGAWTDFSDCTVSCGGGETYRQRGIEVEAKNGGQSCSLKDSTEMASCNTQPCAAKEYCKWSDWTAWDKCSVTCGDGQQKRHRALLKVAYNGAAYNGASSTPTLAAFQLGPYRFVAANGFVHGVLCGTCATVFLLSLAFVSLRRTRVGRGWNVHAPLDDYELYDDSTNAGFDAYHPVPLSDVEMVGEHDRRPALYHLGPDL